MVVVRPLQPPSIYESEMKSGKIEVNLVASKARIAPMKGETIPRMELMSALILARLITTVSNLMLLRMLLVLITFIVGKTPKLHFGGFMVQQRNLDSLFITVL